MKKIILTLVVCMIGNVCLTAAPIFLKERLIVERNFENQDKLEVTLPIPSYFQEVRYVEVYGPHPSCGQEMIPVQHCSWQGSHYVCWTDWIYRDRVCHHLERRLVYVVDNPNFSEVNFTLKFDPRAKLSKNEFEEFQISYDYSKKKAYVLVKKHKYKYERDDYGMSANLGSHVQFNLNLD